MVKDFLVAGGLAKDGAREGSAAMAVDRVKIEAMGFDVRYVLECASLGLHTKPNFIIHHLIIKPRLWRSALASQRSRIPFGPAR